MKITWLLVLTVLWTAPALADRIYVSPAQGSGVDDPDMASLRALIRTSVTELHSQVEDDATKADYTLSPYLIRLGNAFVVKLEKSKDGKVLFSSSLKAAHIEELDKVALRITRSVINNERGADDTRVGEITDEEAYQGTQRKPTLHEWYLGFGGAAMGNLNHSGVGVDLSGARVWDLNVAAIRVFLDFAIAGDAYFGEGGIGVNVFLTNSDIAPFLSGDVGYGFSKADEGGVFSGESATGFVLGIGGGVTFFRTSAVNLELGVRAGFLLANTDFGHPNAVLFRVGLYF